MKGPVKFYKELRPDVCDMLAAWPGIGNVGLIVAKYLQSQLNAEEVGELEPFEFFDPVGIMVKNNLIEAPKFPESKFYYWHNPQTDRGLLLFISDEQPSFKGYELARCVLNSVRRLNVDKVYATAAAMAKIHHTERPRVWGAATSQRLVKMLEKYDVVLRGDVQIAGLNGLFLGVAKELGIEGICLLGEVPSYVTRIPNPKAALAVLEVLTQILDIKIDFTELAALAKESEEEMKKLAAEAMGEYIDRYTKPIWPPLDEEEEEEDDEEEEDEEEEF